MTSSNNITYPYEASAIRVEQPIGTFFVAVLPAELLLQVSESDQLRADLNIDGEGYTLSGTQRGLQDKRLTQIADYINRFDSAFPNSIILAANYNSALGVDQEEADEMSYADLEEATPAKRRDEALWTIVTGPEKSVTLMIPSAQKLATIIDGQHRLFAFVKANRSRIGMNLICSIFLDLPKPYQAQLFATINSTQKPVDRSLTYELFGYNISEEREDFWSPDKLAVFLTRKVGTEPSSPMYRRITVAPKHDDTLEVLSGTDAWKVSTAVVVDGIMRLITSNPKRDSNALRTPSPQKRSVLSAHKDRSPLRKNYIDGSDNLIYQMVTNYLKACNELFWTTCTSDSFIRKTVGIQALFDILRLTASDSIKNKDISVQYFEKLLAGASQINFADTNFRSPSGSGRTKIRRAIEAKVPGLPGYIATALRAEGI